LARNVSNWLNKKKVFPHNVLVFEEEHRLDLGNVVETAVDVSSKNHNAIFR
jgi:site-specific DNA-methyltransferase (adenine-specific)